MNFIKKLLIMVPVMVSFASAAWSYDCHIEVTFVPHPTYPKNIAGIEKVFADEIKKVEDCKANKRSMCESNPNPKLTYKMKPLIKTIDQNEISKESCILKAKINCDIQKENVVIRKVVVAKFKGEAVLSKTCHDIPENVEGKLLTPVQPSDTPAPSTPSPETLSDPKPALPGKTAS